jgi:hypothetical protein
MGDLMAFGGLMTKNDLNALAKRTRMDFKAPKNSGQGLRIPMNLTLIGMCSIPVILSVLSLVVLR